MHLITLMNEDATRNRVITCAIVFAMALILLLPALVNGFPFVFPDTETYLAGGGLRHLPEERTIYYGIFNRLTNCKLSPWPTVVVQSLLTLIGVRPADWSSCQPLAGGDRLEYRAIGVRAATDVVDSPRPRHPNKMPEGI